MSSADGIWIVHVNITGSAFAGFDWGYLTTRPSNIRIFRCPPEIMYQEASDEDWEHDEQDDVEDWEYDEDREYDEDCEHDEQEHDVEDGCGWHVMILRDCHTTTDGIMDIDRIASRFWDILLIKMCENFDSKLCPPPSLHNTIL